MLRQLSSRSRISLSRLARQLSDTTPAASAALPSSAAVVIIGGGIIGNSVAYHLGKMGVKDVVLLEQNQVTSGTTWHAAGLMVTFGSLSETSTEIRKYSKNLYAKVLEEETGQSTGFKPVGFIELASDADRLEEYRRVAAFNRKCGVDVQEIGPQDVAKLFPLARTDDLLAGFYVKDDGRVNPVDVTMALAKGARMRGVRIIEGARVTQVLTERMADQVTRRVCGVQVEGLRGGSEQGGVHTISCEKVVNCAGMWARQLGASSGVSIPNQAAEHYYLVTEPMPQVSADWPVIEDPANYTYIRPEAGGLMVGLFEGKAAPWMVPGIPSAFAFGEIDPDWERMAPYLEAAMSRVPACATAGVRKFFCGPESFTPDLAPAVGEAPELRNYFVGAGLNSIGILSGGGIGRLLAHWVATGRPDMDVTGMNVDRFQAFQCTPRYREQRVAESLGQVYKCHYPYKSKETARGAKRSPFYGALQAAGAYFKDVSGWEGVDWFAPAGTQPVMGTHTWGRYPWFPQWAAEHRACREGVVAMDMSFMSKFLVQGRDAGAALNHLSTADIDGALQTITYTQWLSDSGHMQADLTVSKLAEDRFLVIATDTAHRHVQAWMSRYLDPAGSKHVTVTDVTGAYAQLNIQGPRSRELMALLTDSDMSDAAFPFRHVREVSIGLANVYCARITYLGELGYELHIPCEHALHVLEEVQAKGEGVGLVLAGLKALASLRMEKAYRDYGHDMDNTDTLLEVGLGFTADMAKGPFMGREAVAAQREALKRDGGLPSRLVQVLVGDPAPMLYHGEVLYRNGVRVGDVRSASYGHTLGGAVGLALVTAPEGVVNKAFLTEGDWQIEIAAGKYPCKLSLSPMYDPNNKRIKA